MLEDYPTTEQWQKRKTKGLCFYQLRQMYDSLSNVVLFTGPSLLEMKLCGEKNGPLVMLVVLLGGVVAREGMDSGE